MLKTSLLIIAISFSTLLQAQPSLTRDQQEIQQTVISFFESLSNRDSVSLKSYSTTDITLFEYGRVWTLDTLIRRVIKLNTATDFKRVNSLEFINSSADKNTAWATYNLHSEITREGKQVSIHWLESVILVREKKKWRIKVLHSTMIKRT
ncbi:MAG: nuclear transport factor 2 family protein [Cyclobacteriaceae bacterium]|nr:nuclear transport factor 2 family protein [Cyclobacteriaceae bacterium]